MKKFYLLTILCALLGISQAWGETCYVYEEATGGNVTGGSSTLIFETPIFENTDGIDRISFTYNAPGNSWFDKGGMEVLYSLDGTSYKSWSEKGEGSNRHLDDDIAANHEARNAIRFKFQTRKVSGYHAVWAIQVRKAPTLKLDKSSDVFPKIAVGSNTSKTYTVSTWNVSSEIKVAISGDNASLFSYELSEPTGSTRIDRTLTITYSPDEASESHSALVTVSTDDASSATLSLTASADAEVDPAYTCNIADKYYVEDEELDLTTLWTSTSAGAITYSIVSFEAASGDQEGATAPALREGRYVSLGQAGILNLKLTQVEKGAYSAGEDTKTVTIARRTPEITWYAGTVYYNSTIENFWSSNNSDTKVTVVSSDEDVLTIENKTVTTYNVETSVYITLTQAGNYKWNAHEENHDVTLVYPANHVDFEITEENYNNPNFVTPHVDSGRFRWDAGGVALGSLNAVTEVEGWTYRSFDIEFTGIPDSLSFDYERTISTATGMNWYVAESVDKITWDTTWHKDGGANGSHKMQLKPTTRNVRLIGWMNYGSRFKNIKITERHQFDADNVDFGEIELNSEAAEKTLTFKHANAGYNVSVDFDEAGETKFFTIDHLTVANTGGDKYGEENFKVTFNPSVLGEHTATVTFSDLLGNEKVVTLSANVIKITPTVTAPEAKELTYSGFAQDLVDAATTDGGTLLYRIGEGEWGTSIPKATNAGDYVVKYRVVGDDTYFDVAEASVNVTIAKATPVIESAPQATDIKLGQTLADSYLDNGEASVNGTFAWQDNTIKPDSTGNKKYNVIFTPNDTENYNTVIIEVEVRVTDQETAVFNTESGLKATKILRDGQVLILRDGKVYNIQGMEVR